MVLTAALLALLAQTRDSERVHVELYKRCAPAVVGVEQGGSKGSGVVIDARGFVIASGVTVRDDRRRVTITFAGGRTEEAAVVARYEEKELAVLKLSGERESYAALELGESKEARPGKICYVLGDSFSSIFTDGQPAISVGAISARYAVEKRKRNTYAGEVLETSAAVNPSQGGAPLLDAGGRVLGLVTMNYDDSRFAGIAVPIEAMREEIEAAIEGRRLETVDAAGHPGWLGADFDVVDGQVVVSRVYAAGPAAEAELRKGDLVVSVDHRGRRAAIRTMEELQAVLKGVAAGDAVTLRVYRESTDREHDVPITAAEPVFY